MATIWVPRTRAEDLLGKQLQAGLGLGDRLARAVNSESAYGGWRHDRERWKQLSLEILGVIYGDGSREHKEFNDSDRIFIAAVGTPWHMEARRALERHASSLNVLQSLVERLEFAEEAHSTGTPSSAYSSPMEARHQDALRRIVQADSIWSRDGHEPRPFDLLALGGMRRVVDHPRWDESWAVPSEATIDDLEELGLVRVKPHGPHQNGRTFSLTMRGRQESTALIESPTAGTAEPPPAAGGYDATVRAPAPTAVISWAHGDDGWQARVAEFAFRLRQFGIDVDIDLWHLHEPSINWSIYGPQAIQEREFVLIPVSAAYRERWEGKGASGTGAGAAREANTLKALFDRDQEAFQRKVKIILLPGATVDDIPAELQSSAQQFHIDALDEAGLEDLLRTLSGQPAHVAPPLGTLPVLPPIHGGDDHDRPVRDPSDDLAKAITNLPGRQKLVVALLYYEDLTLHDVASVLGESPRDVVELELAALDALGPMAEILKQRLDAAD